MKTHAPNHKEPRNSSAPGWSGIALLPEEVGFLADLQEGPAALLELGFASRDEGKLCAWTTTPCACYAPPCWAQCSGHSCSAYRTE